MNCWPAVSGNWLSLAGRGARRVYRVPGAFELPVSAKVLAETKRVNAVICIGAVVRGDTPHFDYVAGEAARGCQNVATATGVPVIFGVLTTNTEQQALDRTGGSHGHAGERAAEAAVEMICMLARLGTGEGEKEHESTPINTNLHEKRPEALRRDKKLFDECQLPMFSFVEIRVIHGDSCSSSRRSPEIAA